MSPFLVNLSIALIVAAVEIMVVSVFVKRLINKRDANRWMPFRRYLLQVLFDESLRSVEAVTKLCADLKASVDGSKESVPWTNLFDQMTERIEETVETLESSKLKVHQAIQTAAPSITSGVANFFINIFRALDHAPDRGKRLLLDLERDRPDGESTAPATKEVSERVKSSVEVESFKLLTSVSALGKGVEGLIRHEGYMVIEGQVSTPDDLERLRQVEAMEAQYRAKAGAGN